MPPTHCGDHCIVVGASRIGYFSLAMRENEGFEIRHNGVPRTFRDREDVAFHAARYAKSLHPADIIEVVDCSTGRKVIMLADGRTG